MFQPWTNLRLNIYIGLFVCADVTKIQESNHKQFPMLGYTSYFTVLSPNGVGDKFGLPSMPYIIDQRDTEDEETMTLPTSWNIKSAYMRLFTTPSAPHVKSSMDNLREAMQGDWRKDKPAKYCFPPPVQEGPMETAGAVSQGKIHGNVSYYSHLSCHTG